MSRIRDQSENCLLFSVYGENKLNVNNSLRAFPSEAHAHVVARIHHQEGKTTEWSGRERERERSRWEERATHLRIKHPVDTTIMKSDHNAMN